MAVYADKIKLPTEVNGLQTLETVYFIDSKSGYTKNTGTITEVKTSAGAHTTIDVTSGAATFNVPTTAEHVGAVPTSSVGAAGGVAPLNSTGKIDGSYLPSYVDDVVEGYYYNGNFYKESTHTTVITGETGKIYIDLATDKIYRYGGSTYAEIAQGSLVTVTRDLTSGTKIGTISINGTGNDLYAPTPPTVTSTYSSTGTNPVDGRAVYAAIQTLDSAIAETTGQAISAITISDGKITSSSKINVPSVTSTYSSTGTNAVDGRAVYAAIQTLDSTVEQTTGQALAALTISDGKITGSTKVNVGDANQNAFSNVKIGNSTIAADSVTDTIELVAGGLVTLTPDTTNDKITISASYTETDPTVPAWAKASTKPNYTAEDIQYQGDPNGHFGGAAVVGDALDIADGLFTSLGSSIANLEATQPYVLTYGASVNDTEVAQVAFFDKRPIFLKYLDGDMQDYSMKYIAHVDIDGQADQGNEGTSVLEFYDSEGWLYGYIEGTGWVRTYLGNNNKVTNTLDVSKKYYITGTSSSVTNTGTQFFDNNIYATTTTGQLNATTYKVNEQVTLQWNSTDSCLDFIFA